MSVIMHHNSIHDKFCCYIHGQADDVKLCIKLAYVVNGVQTFYVR